MLAFSSSFHPPGDVLVLRSPLHLLPGTNQEQAFLFARRNLREPHPRELALAQVGALTFEGKRVESALYHHDCAA